METHGVDVPNKLMTVEEAAAVLGMGRSTLYRLIREGSVPYRLIPTGVLKFAPAEIDKILADGYRPPVERRRRRLSVAG